MKIKFTKHAGHKIIERDIKIEDIQTVISTPEITLNDKYDEKLIHFVRTINDKYLRIVGKFTGKEEFLVVSAFYDRRLKRGINYDKNKL